MKTEVNKFYATRDRQIIKARKRQERLRHGDYRSPIHNIVTSRVEGGRNMHMQGRRWRVPLWGFSGEAWNSEGLQGIVHVAWLHVNHRIGRHMIWKFSRVAQSAHGPSGGKVPETQLASIWELTWMNSQSNSGPPLPHPANVELTGVQPGAPLMSPQDCISRLYPGGPSTRKSPSHIHLASSMPKPQGRHNL